VATYGLTTRKLPCALDDHNATVDNHVSNIFSKKPAPRTGFALLNWAMITARSAAMAFKLLQPSLSLNQP